MSGDTSPTIPGPVPSPPSPDGQATTRAGSPPTKPQESADAAPPTATGANAAGVTATGVTASDAAARLAKVIAMAGTVPGYEILDELGRGGMGVVYKARQQSLNRLVALKMILTADDGDSPIVARFLAEAEAVAAIRHPNVVQVHDYGESDGRPFMALEYLSGGTLADRLKAGARIPAREAAALAEKIARGLQAAHAKGIIHRDIKPGNILFDEGGEPKVADFGLAKRADSDLTRTGAVMGTPAYMAPEQADGHTREVGPQADVWSVGVILYEALTGTRPFTAKRTDQLLIKVLMSDPDSLRSRSGDVPRDLETICMKCLEKNPARRYPSALALAQDLERFQAGEPILARPEGAVKKAWRRVRRRGLTVCLALALVLAVGIAASLVIQSSSQRQVNELTRQLDEGLEAAEWPEGHRDNLVRLSEQLAALDPAQGDAVRAKLTDRVARRVRAVLGRSRVLPADVQAVEEEVRWLASRDPAAASRLDAEIRGRLRAWQVVAELATPFAEAAAVFPPGSVRTSAEGLLPADRKSGGNTVLTALRSVGEVRFEAEFGEGWVDSREVGVGIDSSAGAPGYQFVFAASQRPLPAELSEEPRDPGAKSVRTFRGTGGHGEVRILREGVVLRQRTLEVTGGPLRVTAERDGDRLWVQVNESEPLVFNDLAPVVGREGAAFGVVWPDRVPLTLLRASNRPVPREASPLEKADDLYSRRDFTAALLLYQQQARTGDPAVRTEARCKAGLCLASLNRLDEAMAEFEAVAASPGDRWPVTASMQMALILVQQKRFADADALFSVAMVRCTPEQVARYVPASVRHEILAQPGLPGSTYVLPTAAALRRTEALYKLHELLAERGQVSSRLYDLARAHALVGEDEKAEREFGDIIREATPDPVRALQPNWLLPWAVRWFAWVKARRQGAEAAVNGIMPTARLMGVDTHASKEPVPPAAAGVAVTVARLYSIVGQRHISEGIIDRVLRTEFLAQPHAYVWYAEAWLMRGFFAADRGDEAEARAAWKNAAFPAYCVLRDKAGVPPVDTENRGYGLYYRLLAGSLSGELTDAEAADIWQKLLLLVTDDPLVTQVAATVQIGPSILRGMWSSPRGREMARRVVFLDMHPADLTRLPLRLIGYEKLRQDLFEGKATPVQDDVLWQAMVRVGDAFFEGRITKVQMFPLALAWKGTSGTLGWASVAGVLQPDARGPLAYAMGVRYLKLNKPADARAIFRTAAGDAPAGSALARLAAEELAKLEGKPPVPALPVAPPPREAVPPRSSTERTPRPRDPTSA